MITPAYAVHEGNHRYLQDVDLTASISAIGMRDIDKIIAWSQGKQPLVGQITQSPPHSVRAIAWKGQLYLPEFISHLKGFLEAVPTQEDMRNLQSHLRELDRVL